MRVALALVAPALAFVTVAACGGPDAASPRDRAAVRVVQCLPAQPPPTLAAEGAAADELHGVLIGTSSVTVPRAKVVISDVTIESGTFDASAVRRALTPRLPNLQACYARATATTSAGAKSLKLRFTILPSGTIAGVREIADGRMSTPVCVRSVVEGMSVGMRPRAGSVLVVVGLRVDVPEDAPREPDLPSADPWTPFALGTALPDDEVGLVARAAEAALHDKRAALAACFPPTAPTGSLRLMLELGEDGKLLGARAGGLGDARIEACVRAATADLQVAAPSTEAAEIACDLAHGNAESWRLTPAAGYRVIHASAKALTHGSQTVPADTAISDPLGGDAAYLIVAEPDARGAVLTLALSWAYEGSAVLVALADPRAPQTPRFLGVGRSAASVLDNDEAERGALPTVRLGDVAITACVDRTTQVARLAEPALVSALLQNVAQKCRAIACERTLVVALDPQARARDLVEVTGAARRAGFDRVLLGGDGCGGPRRKPAIEDEVLEDDEL